MNLGDVLVVVLLVVGVSILVLCCIGVLVVRGAYARLHYGSAAGPGALALALAILVRQGFSLIGDKALLTAAFLLVTAPVAAHVTARAAYIRERDRDGGGGE